MGFFRDVVRLCFIEAILSGNYANWKLGLAIGPANRDTPLARKMILDYSRQGNCELRYAVGSDTFPRTEDSTIQVRVDVNGSTGAFILDTGASFVTVTSNFALRSKVHVSEQSVQTQTGGRACRKVCLVGPRACVSGVLRRPT